MLKVYAVYSKSHQDLFDKYFFPSLQNTDLELHVKKCQEIGSGEYLQEDYLKSILYKVDTIIQAIRENYNGIFIFSDVDIIFFQKVSEDLIFLLRDNDIVFQSDNYRKTIACTGFFICRGNVRTLNLWMKCRKRLEHAILEKIQMHDQDFMNEILHEKPKIVKFGYLPLDRYYCPRDFLKLENIFPIPNNICIYHANWIIQTQNISGIQHKELLLDKVQEIIRSRRGISSLRYFSKLPFHIIVYCISVVKKQFSKYNIHSKNRKI